ncbi:hypothetical protein ADUPG1_010885, partial [Aduncisulcus paluster]
EPEEPKVDLSTIMKDNRNEKDVGDEQTNLTTSQSETATFIKESKNDYKLELLKEMIKFTKDVTNDSESDSPENISVWTSPLELYLMAPLNSMTIDSAFSTMIHISEASVSSVHRNLLFSCIKEGESVIDSFKKMWEIEEERKKKGWRSKHIADDKGVVSKEEGEEGEEEVVKDEESSFIPAAYHYTPIQQLIFPLEKHSKTLLKLLKSAMELCASEDELIYVFVCALRVVLVLVRKCHSFKRRLKDRLRVLDNPSVKKQVDFNLSSIDESFARMKKSLEKELSVLFSLSSFATVSLTDITPSTSSSFSLASSTFQTATRSILNHSRAPFAQMRELIRVGKISDPRIAKRLVKNSKKKAEDPQLNVSSAEPHLGALVQDNVPTKNSNEIDDVDLRGCSPRFVIPPSSLFFDQSFFSELRQILISFSSSIHLTQTIMMCVCVCGIRRDSWEGIVKSGMMFELIKCVGLYPHGYPSVCVMRLFERMLCCEEGVELLCGASIETLLSEIDKHKTQLSIEQRTARTPNTISSMHRGLIDSVKTCLNELISRLFTVNATIFDQHEQEQSQEESISLVNTSVPFITLSRCCMSSPALKAFILDTDWLCERLIKVCTAGSFGQSTAASMLCIILSTIPPAKQAVRMLYAIKNVLTQKNIDMLPFLTRGNLIGAMLGCLSCYPIPNGLTSGTTRKSEPNVHAVVFSVITTVASVALNLPLTIRSSIHNSL